MLVVYFVALYGMGPAGCHLWAAGPSPVFLGRHFDVCLAVGLREAAARNCYCALRCRAPAPTALLDTQSLTSMLEG